MTEEADQNPPDQPAGQPRATGWVVSACLAAGFLSMWAITILVLFTAIDGVAAQVVFVAGNLLPVVIAVLVNKSRRVLAGFMTVSGSVAALASMFGLLWAALANSPDF